MLRCFAFIFSFFLICSVSSSALKAASPVDSLKSLETELSIQSKHPELFKRFYSVCKFELTPNDPLALYAIVSRWLGTPYRYGGLSKKGVDCQGFVRVIYDSLFCEKLSAGAGNQYHQCDPVKKDSLQAGDLIFFKIASRSISHVGIYLKDGWFAHATVSGYGVVLSRLDAPYYRRWFFAAGRVKLLESISPN